VGKVFKGPYVRFGLKKHFVTYDIITQIHESNIHFHFNDNIV